MRAIIPTRPQRSITVLLMDAPAIDSTVTPRPNPEDEYAFERHMSMLVAFFTSPLIMWLVLSAIISLQSVGATGLPLGSPGGQLSILLATIGMLIISQTARWSPMGLFILSGWAAAFAFYVTVSMESPLLPHLFQDQALLRWCYFPVLIFTICLAAALATRRTGRQRLASSLQPTTCTHWTWPMTLLAGGLALVVNGMVFYLAPRTVAPLVMQQPDRYLTLEPTQGILLLLLIAAVFTLTWLANLRPLPIQVAAWVLMLLPGLVVIPLFTTVAGWMPTPDNELAASLALSMPVIGTLGATIVATTQPLFSLSKPEEGGTHP